mmetsp:Transcript_16547/g.34148  ORF Transcript_16547/g.34148 Transcript_16547/m.34148 type:complete len:291 (+) Transcript_16547:2-874(+)
MTGLGGADSLSNNASGSRKGGSFGKREWKAVFLFASMATMRAWLNLLSCSMTAAYNVALVNSLTPLVAPFLQSACLGTKIPKNLLLSIFVTTCGCALVGIGQSPYVLGGAAKLTYTDGLGCLLQFVSVVFSNLARIVMMTSDGILTRGQLVQSQNVSTLTFCVIVGFVTGGWGLFADAAETLVADPKAMITFMFLTAGIFTFAGVLQVGAVRKLGASVYGSYSGWRVLVCVFGSYAWLKEPVTSYVEWVGIAIVVLVLTIYLRKNVKSDDGERDGVVAEETPQPTSKNCC